MAAAFCDINIPRTQNIQYCAKFNAVTGCKMLLMYNCGYSMEYVQPLVEDTGSSMSMECLDTKG